MGNFIVLYIHIITNAFSQKHYKFMHQFSQGIYRMGNVHMIMMMYAKKLKYRCKCILKMKSLVQSL